MLKKMMKMALVMMTVGMLVGCGENTVEVDNGSSIYLEDSGVEVEFEVTVDEIQWSE